MKIFVNAFSLFLLLGLLTNSSAQVLCSKSATLKSGRYDLEGTAKLELNQDSTLTLKLLDDYKTEKGPDVQIFLTNNAVFANSSLKHKVALLDPTSGPFSGATSFNISEKLDFDTYIYVHFICVRFGNLDWGSGSFGADEGTCTQQVVAEEALCSKSATLNRGMYDLEGTAKLELNQDSTLTLKLLSDYKTQSGPDVQIFLTNNAVLPIAA